MSHSYEYKTIFSFWEPQEGMTPYLELCKKTWERHLPKYNIIFLDYSNIADYIPVYSFDIEAIKQAKFMLPVQKDAIMAAVLREHGGIFMDADTIVLRDISPVVSKLKETEMIMFNTHLAFVAARPGAYILELWLMEIQRKMNDLMDRKQVEQEPSWDFLGNSILADVMDEIISRAGYLGKFQKYFLDKGILALQAGIKNIKINPLGLEPIIDKFCNSLRNKKRVILFHILFPNLLNMLDRLEYGFIPEANFFNTRRITPAEQYKKFWFENDGDIQDVFLKNQMIIGLHNSWTPQWYKDFSEKEVLENDCLLSRTLKYLLKD
jgi:Capsular polysaccharide synthesis protein